MCLSDDAGSSQRRPPEPAGESVPDNAENPILANIQHTHCPRRFIPEASRQIQFAAPGQLRCQWAWHAPRHDSVYTYDRDL